MVNGNEHAKQRFHLEARSGNDRKGEIRMGRFYIRQSINARDGRFLESAKCINVDKIHFIDMTSGLVNGKIKIQVHIYTAAGHRAIMMDPDELERFNTEWLDNNEDIKTMIEDLRASDENRAISNKN